MPDLPRHAVALALALAAGCGGAPDAPDTPPTAETAAVKPALPDFDAAWNYGDPAATRARFEAIEAEVGPDADLDYRLALRTQIARCQGLERDFAAAHATLDAIEPMLADAPQARVRWLLEKGRVFNSSGEKGRARPLFEEAWRQAQALDADGYAVDAAHMVAIVEEPAASLTWNQKALALAESSADPAARKWRGALYNNIGWNHHDAGRFDAALAVFERGVAFRETAGKPVPLRIARWTVARTLRSLNRPQEALVTLEALEAEWRTAGAEDGFVYEELGEVRLMLGEPEVARGWFAKAHPLLAQMRWLAEGEPRRLERIAELGGVEGGAPAAGD